MTKILGFTLIETLLAIVILGVLAALTLPALQTGFNAFFNTGNLTSATRQGTLAMERLSRDLRNIPMANAISTANNTQLIYVDTNNNTVNYQLSGTTLTLNGQTLAKGVNQLAFSYYDSTGTVTSIIANISYIGIALNITQNNTNLNFASIINLRNVPS